MRQVLPMRMAELEDRAPLADWQLELQFIAHDLDAGMTENLIIDGLPVTIRYRRFDEFRGFPVDADFVRIVSEHFTAPLNAVHVHPRTRGVVLGLI